MQHIKAKALARLIKKAPDIRIIDVREADELAYGMINGALHIPMNDIATRLEQVGNLDDPIVLVCHAGVRSQHVGQYLEQLGYTNIINLSGGMNSWATEVDYSMTPY